MLKTKMKPSPNSDDIGGMNLKKELRPYARQLVTTLDDNGGLSRDQVKDLRDAIKRAPKADVVSMTENLRSLCEDAGLPSTPGATKPSSSNPTPSASSPTTPSTSKPNVERVNLAQQAEELSSNDTEQSSPDSSDDTVTKDEVNQMIHQALMTAKQPNQVTTPTTSDKLEHWQLPLLQAIVETNRQALIVCGAGSGKTTIAETIADKLGFDVDKEFYSISLSSGVSEAHLSGRMVMTGEFLDTEFLNIVENGGVILLDEFDNADPDVLVGLNSLLANDRISCPLRRGAEQAIRNENCYIICTANTWGNGSGGSSGYQRKQLDSATLDRFVGSKFYMGQDRRITNFVMGLTDEKVSYPEAIQYRDMTIPVDTEVVALRLKLDYIKSCIDDSRRNIRQLLGVRAYAQGAKLIRQQNFSSDLAVALYLQNWTDDQLKTIGVNRDYDSKLDMFSYNFTNQFLREVA
jgi:hypothetical protein